MTAGDGLPAFGGRLPDEPSDKTPDGIGDFEAVAAVIKNMYLDDLTAWRASPFMWLRALSAQKKGAAMEDLVRRWCSLSGFPTDQSAGSESDCRIGKVLIEIKGSTLWESGIYQFNQIRKQNYDILFLLGISPDRVDLWCPPKRVVMKHVKPQHGGKVGTDTFLLKFPATEPPFWLQKFGGTPAQAAVAIHKAVGFRSTTFDW